MKSLVTILLVAVLTADAVIFYQMRRLFKSWEKDAENDDKQLTDEEVHYVEVRTRLLSVLGTAALILFLLRFVICDLFPLIRG